MKNRWFMCLLLLSIVSGKTFARNDYLPTIVEGKQWLVTSEAIKAHYDFLYYVSGDTVIDGNDCKKLYMKMTISQITEEEGQLKESSTHGPALHACLQESDGKVYTLNNGERKLLYDFNLVAGDVVFDTDHLTLSVTKVDTILVNGIKRKRLWMKETYKDYNIGERTGYWVEGIGSSYGIVDSYAWDAIPMPVFSECKENGIVVFSASDFDVSAWSGGTETSLSDKTMILPSTATYIDLQGRRIDSPAARGVYIQNGRKVVK